MTISVTPTLSSSEGYLVDVRDQVVSLMRFLVMNPGGTSDIWEGLLISFRTISSAKESSRVGLASALESKLSEILHRKFADYSFDVVCSTEDYDVTATENTDVRYSISFSILINKSDGTQTGAIVDGSISVDKKTNEISLSFSNSYDNQTLS